MENIRQFHVNKTLRWEAVSLAQRSTRMSYSIFVFLELELGERIGEGAGVENWICNIDLELLWNK